jgi:hypothetical protein
VLNTIINDVAKFHGVLTVGRVPYLKLCVPGGRRQRRVWRWEALESDSSEPGVDSNYLEPPEHNGDDCFGIRHFYRGGQMPPGPGFREAMREVNAHFDAQKVSRG